jgi:Domain of unknown function (DUF4173)
MTPPLRRPLALLTTALALGLCADLLFYNRTPGLSAPLFVGLILVALARLGRAEGRDATLANSWLGAAALLFAGLMALRAAPLLIVLNAMAATGLLLLHATLYRAAPLTILDGWRVGAGAALAAIEAAIAPLPLAFGQAARLRGAGEHGRALLVVGRGAVLAAPVLLVFTGLLAMADSVFASYIGDLFSLQLPFDLEQIGGHLVFTAIFGWAAAGGLLVALRAHDEGALLGPPPRELPAEGETQRLRLPLKLRFLGWGEALTVLALVDLLFAAFMLIQGAYLFGGLDTLERSGMTFADYARRGFFELVTVACLTLGLLWGLALVARRERAEQRRSFNAASALMVLLVLGMLASAALRMWLYEQAYGFTLLRLLTHSFMGWLASILLLFVVALLRDRPRLFSLGLPAAAAAYLLALNLLNPDAMIVRENVARYQATGDLDSYYLSTLSPDAAPAIAAALPLLGAVGEPLRAYLIEQQRELELAAASDGWPGWNYGRWRASGVQSTLESRQP